MTRKGEDGPEAFILFSLALVVGGIAHFFFHEWYNIVKLASAEYTNLICSIRGITYSELFKKII